MDDQSGPDDVEQNRPGQVPGPPPSSYPPPGQPASSFPTPPPGWSAPWGQSPSADPTDPGASPGDLAGGPPPPPYGTPPYGTPPYGGGWHWGPPGPGGHLYGTTPWHPGYPGYRGYPPAPPGGRRALVGTVLAAGVLLAALFGGLVGHDLSRTSGGSGFAGIGGGSSPTSPPANAPANAAAIASAIDPCLVDVNTVITAEGVQGAGTGMVLSSTGEVLTNNHVVEGANRISVTDVGNGKVYNATVVGYDRTQDVAVLQLSGATGLTTCPVGNSTSVSAGLGVVAVGNANGSGGTPSYAAGTVTATNQTITASDEVDGSSEQLSGLLETNANIVAGDSGGPLVDASGRIIGMDTAASAGFQFENSSTQGYAIPINQATNIAKQIESGTSSSTVHVGPTAFLGVGVRDATNGGSPFGGGSSSGQGAKIVQIVSGGPADQAGLVVGDVITAVNGQRVGSAEALTEAMTTQKPGNSVNVTYQDSSGQQHTVAVVLGSGPSQ